MHGLAQIQVQILTRAPTLAVHRGGGNGIAHHGDADRRAQPMTGRDEGILTGKCDPPSRVGCRQSDVGKQIIKRRDRVELGIGHQRCGVDHG
jgi:hypothetical protein